MQQFNARQYVAIDLANHAGMDKLSWDERIQWVKDNMGQLDQLIPDDPKTKFLYIKALEALRNTEPTGFIMALDSTNSGAQVMSVLGKCGKSASTCNVIYTGKREDLYTNIMNQVTAVGIIRQQVKEAVVPMMYGSKAAPKELFGEGTPQLKAFTQAVENTVPILGEMMALMQSIWQSNSKWHEFVMPDGHHVVLPTMVLHTERIRMATTSFTYQWKDIGTSDNSTSLLANVVHATDAYISREMVRKANKAGFQLAHIHDSYWCSPVYMGQVRQFYKDILIELAKSNLLENICSQIAGEKVELTYTHPNLWEEMKDAEYMLS